MLLSLSAMIVNPLSCIKSSPVFDFRLPVDKKYSKDFPILPFSRPFFRYYNSITLFGFGSLPDVTSLIILVLKNPRKSSDPFWEVKHIRSRTYSIWSLLSATI